MREVTMSATASVRDPIETQHDLLIDDIRRGLLVPVVGGDINLCGRPLRENTVISWAEQVNGIKSPPSSSELASHLLDQVKDHEKLDPDLKEVLYKILK